MGGLFPGEACGFQDLGGGALVITDRRTCKYFQICVIGYWLITAQNDDLHSSWFLYS